MHRANSNQPTSKRLWRTRSAHLFLFIAVCCLWCVPRSLSAQPFVAIHYRVKGFDERYRQETIIAQAMQIIHDRFRRIDVLREAYQLSGDSYYIMGGYWESC